MKKDKLYFLTFISITFIYLLIAVLASQFFIKASANQLIEVQVESSKREANEISKLLDYQLEKGIEKQSVLKKTQQIITNSNSDSWFISVFNWSGTTEVHPDVTRVGLAVDSNQTLLNSLKEKNNSTDLYDILQNNALNKSSEVIYISPLKNADLIIAAHVNIASVNEQMSILKNNFYIIFSIMGIVVIVLSFLAVRILGSAYEKQLELKNSNLASEVINMSKLNADLVSYQEKVTVKPEDKSVESVSENEKQRILTYVRNELVPISINEISYIFTESTITYVVNFDGKRSTSNASLDDMISNLNPQLFFRANRQFIISIAAIDKIIKYGNSQLKIVLKGKVTEEIIISKNKAAEFKQWLNL
jgi:Na+-transporting methylmalonyl-CoA/oxaloacetate decarboxylase gamma subunit